LIIENSIRQRFNEDLVMFQCLRLYIWGRSVWQGFDGLDTTCPERAVQELGGAQSQAACAEHRLFSDCSHTAAFHSLKLESIPVRHKFDFAVVSVSWERGQICGDVFSTQVLVPHLNQTSKSHRALAMTTSRLSSHEKARPCILDNR